jgi:hypothetical protein
MSALPVPIDLRFRQARTAARKALRQRVDDETYLLGRELELLAVADRYDLAGVAEAVESVDRLRRAVGLRRDLIRRLEAELDAGEE